MNIFVLNRGSSSIKCYLYQFKNKKKQEELVWEAKIQWKNGFENPSLFVKNIRGQHHTEKMKSKNAASALEYLVSFLVQRKTAALRSLDQVDVIGHRIVHGGEWFSKSVLITADVKEKIQSLAEFAPLHNLPELEGIKILEKQFPKTVQVAVFDTAFHHTLSKEAQVYPGPYEWYKQGIKRYGFHGISFQYCTKRASQILGKNSKQLKMVICHLGSGASLCAVKNGKSIDTTMGFTPLEGLMMDTRSGTIDPGIILYLLEKKTPQLLSKELYEKSGLFGISGMSSDMRDIIEKSSAGKPRAQLAFEIYLHRLNALIGSMIASLQGLDVLVFTAGIGENAPLLRKRVCENFSFLSLKLDQKKNQRSHEKDSLLSTSSSKVKILLVHTQEALEIARECLKFV